MKPMIIRSMSIAQCQSSPLRLGFQDSRLPTARSKWNYCLRITMDDKTYIHVTRAVCERCEHYEKEADNDDVHWRCWTHKSYFATYYKVKEGTIIPQCPYSLEQLLERQ